MSQKNDRTELTKRFISKVNEIIESRQARNKREIVENIGWNEVALSFVMNGKRQVPKRISDKLFEVYRAGKKADTVTEIRLQEAMKKNELLENTVADLRETIRLLKLKN